MSWVASAQDAVSLARAALGRAQHVGGDAELEGVAFQRYLRATNEAAQALGRAETRLAALRAVPLAGLGGDVERDYAERVLLQAAHAIEQARLACEIAAARRDATEPAQRGDAA